MTAWEEENRSEFEDKRKSGVIAELAILCCPASKTKTHEETIRFDFN